jgi:hypothetical protein
MFCAPAGTAYQHGWIQFSQEIHVPFLVGRTSFHKTGARGIARVLNSVAMTVYKIDYSDVDEKPEMQFMCLKRLVGERGFEPPTPWSRTRCSTRLSHSPTDAR